MRAFLSALCFFLAGLASAAERPRDILFILADDHRYDAMSFLGHPWLETPALDRLAKGGAHFPKAMVTTSLCSPSRASILTGLYAHSHRVVDNYNPVSPDLVFFPQLLQAAGYRTAFLGKWHMGETDEPQRGFDHWAVFKGQGTYWPDGHGTSRVVPQTAYDGFNVNGERRPQKGYITDELTDMALEWLETNDPDKPLFLYLSHKAVHSDFVPHDRHLGRYADKPFPAPPTLAAPADNPGHWPRWVLDQRNSRHGAAFGYNLPDFDLPFYYRRYMEALLAVDENVARILDWLEKKGRLESTLVVYMGDNGFQFGEHGLIDKRTAYEASIRVPLLMHCPDLIPAGTVVRETVANIDIAPTLLEIAGALPGDAAERFHGRSFLPLLKGEKVAWRDEILYEYYWEQNYPQTPTVHALVGSRWKYIRPHGTWDIGELYDLESDPREERNLFLDPDQQDRIREMNARLFDLLEESEGENLPLLRDRGEVYPWRLKNGPAAAPFPSSFTRE
ncbi:MAG: sulfatase [Verrucomicrobiae bacterium]|nr:sulfatase [Verrucomicrobiae bacterium]